MTNSGKMDFSSIRRMFIGERFMTLRFTKNPHSRLQLEKQAVKMLIQLKKQAVRILQEKNLIPLELKPKKRTVRRNKQAVRRPDQSRVKVIARI